MLPPAVALALLLSEVLVAGASELRGGGAGAVPTPIFSRSGTLWSDELRRLDDVRRLQKPEEVRQLNDHIKNLQDLHSKVGDLHAQMRAGGLTEREETEVDKLQERSNARLEDKRDGRKVATSGAKKEVEEKEKEAKREDNVGKEDHTNDTEKKQEEREEKHEKAKVEKHGRAWRRMVTSDGRGKAWSEAWRPDNHEEKGKSVEKKKEQEAKEAKTEDPSSKKEKRGGNLEKLEKGGIEKKEDMSRNMREKNKEDKVEKSTEGGAPAKRTVIQGSVAPTRKPEATVAKAGAKLGVKTQRKVAIPEKQEDGEARADREVAEMRAAAKERSNRAAAEARAAQEATAQAHAAAKAHAAKAAAKAHAAEVAGAASERDNPFA